MKRLLVLLPLLLTAACSALTSRADSAARSAVPISDAGRSNLLELAYSGVSMMPLDPHIKNRSRAQQHIVDTCLELGLQELAGRYVEQIENWQRWMGYANLARYYLDHGEPEKPEVS